MIRSKCNPNPAPGSPSSTRQHYSADAYLKTRNSNALAVIARIPTVLKMPHRTTSYTRCSSLKALNMSQLSTLLSLLTEACHSVEQEYAKTSKPLPSLDDTNPHPLDDQFYPPELRKSVRIIEAATAQLCALVGRPNHVIANVSQIDLFKTIANGSRNAQA